MRPAILLLLIALSCSSCRMFETEKVSSDAFLETALETLNWNEVDAYPLFADCSETDSIAAQRACFEKTVLEYVGNPLLEHRFTSRDSFSETVALYLAVDGSGKISLSRMEGGVQVFENFPELRTTLTDRIDSLPITQPALKRGIPVHTEFVLPVVIQSE